MLDRKDVYMDSITAGTILFYGGIVLMGTAVVGAVIAAVILHVSGKRLKNQLEKEFGRKRH